MIQRIQSIYLLLAALFSASPFVFPFASSSAPAEGIFSDSLFDVNDHVALLSVTIAASVLALLTIFLFNNRVLQMNLSKGIMLLLLALLGTVAYFLFSAGAASFSLGISLFTPIIALILVIMAHQGIKKDENLVKSMDRIR